MPLFPQSNTVPSNRGQSSVNNYPNMQVPGMSINIPGMFQPNTTQEPIIVGVHGFDSAKQYPKRPNQTISLHDLDADFEYIINTDVNNQPSYKILEFNQISEEEYKQKYSEAVNRDLGLPTVEEYQEILKRLERLEKEVSANAKQPIQYQRPGGSGSTIKPAAAKSTNRSENTKDISASEN